MLLDDDDENVALAAALSFIDAFPADSLTQEPAPGLAVSVSSNRDLSQYGPRPTRDKFPSTLQHLGPTTKSTRRVKANPNKVRDERKQEIAYLKVKVKQLEVDLGALRTHPPRRLEGHCTGVLISKGSGSTSSGGRQLAVWRGIAERQQKRRDRSERENARLRLVLESQVKTAKSLQALLQRRLRTHMAGCAEAASSLGDLCSQKPSDELLGDSEAFDALLESVDKTYAAMDDVFTKNGLLGSNIPQHDAQMRQDADGIYLDVSSTKMFPFRFEDVAPAVWNHFKGNDKHHGVMCENASQNFGTSSDTILEAFTMQIQHKNRRATFCNNKQIVRRYMEGDRQVVVVESRGEVVQHEASPNSRFGFVEKAYVVTKPADHNGFSAVQMCTLMLPRVMPNCVVDRAIVDFVLDFIAAEVAASQELIENVLLKQSLKPAMGV